MTLTIRCKNCGRGIRETVSLGYSLDDILQKQGYKKSGAAFYCSFCVSEKHAAA